MTEKLINGKTIETVLDEWMPEIEMLSKKYMPHIASDDVKSELLLAFVLAWNAYDAEQGEFAHFLRACLRFKRTSLLRYGYYDGRIQTYTFSDLVDRSQPGAEELLESILHHAQAQAVPYLDEEQKWSNAIREAAASLSAAHIRAAEFFIADVVRQDIAKACKTQPVMYDQLIDEVLEKVRMKHAREVGEFGLADDDILTN